MSNFTRRDALGSAGDLDALLFKPDRPRMIDTYIDYFGAPSSVAAPDWLRRLLDEVPAGDRP